MRTCPWRRPIPTWVWPPRVTVEVTRAVAALEAAGAVLVATATAASLDGAEGSEASAALELVRRYVPAARLVRGSSTVGTLASPGERLAIGYAALAGDSFGPAQPQLVPAERRREFEAATAALGPQWREELAVVGAATPHMNGRSRRALGPWPPYEALDEQRLPFALWERQLLDLRVALVAALGRAGLPGEVGRDVMKRLLLDLPTELSVETAHDWRAFLRWVEGLDDASLDTKVRQCLESGLYSLQL